MPKTEVEAQFDYLVSKIIWPHFKSLGYRKTGNNFRCLHPDGSGKILSFQKSIYYSKSHIHFTINLGFYLPEGQPWAEHQPKFDEPDCFIRKRIGHLRPDGRDHWYDLTVGTALNELYQAVEYDVLTYALPFLAPMNSRQDMLQAMLTGSRPADDTAVQARVLCRNGYRAEAQQQLQQEFDTTYLSHRKAFLQRKAAELGLSLR